MFYKYFNKSLHLFSIFLTKYKEITGGSRLLHSTVTCSVIFLFEICEEPRV